MNGSLPETSGPGVRKIPVTKSAGLVLAHDITEVRPGKFKGAAFRKGQVLCESDICHLQRLGKDNLFVLDIPGDKLHEDDAALSLARSLAGEGVALQGEPHEGKVNLVAATDGLLKVNREALTGFNMAGEVVCATLHDNTVVSRGQVIADTRAIPLIVRRDAVWTAVQISDAAGKILHVKKIRKPRVGLVITGNEVYYGRIEDAFSDIIAKKIASVGGEIVGIRFAPDDTVKIEAGLREMLDKGADLLITTGGMSVDPDDVTRFAIRNLGVQEMAYGAAASPGAMFLAAWLDRAGNQPPIPILGIPACALHAKTTVFDLLLPRILAGERVGRKELAELGHGGLCLKCEECRFPLCPFGSC